MKIVKDSENHGPGGLNPGYGYNMNDKFSMQFCYSGDNAAELLAAIPHSDQMRKVIIT